MPAYIGLDQLTNPDCPNCKTNRYITFQHWPGTPDLWHCNKCGHSTQTKEKVNEAETK